jgi:site-specific DNA recombinase
MSFRPRALIPKPIDAPIERRRVAIYVRVSTEEQAQNGYSIAAQIDRLRDYAKHENCIVLEPYVDDGYSGKDLNRPAMERLLRDAKLKRFDLLVVFKLDRISRKVVDLISLGEHFDKLGIGLRSATEPFDTTNSSGKLLFNMLGSFAQFERELIGERTRLGLNRRKSEGKWNTSEPFGYRFTKDGKLELHPAELPFARRVFQLFLEKNWGAKTIASQMRKEDHVTRRSRGRWHSTSIWKMLSNPVYAGLVNTGDGEYKPLYPTIVSNEEFERVQETLRSRACTNGPQLHSPNVLTGLIRCGLCGKGMTTAKGKGTYYYACLGRDKGCTLEYIPSRGLEKAILDEIRNIAAMPDVIERYLDKVQHENDRAGKGFGNERASLKKQIDAATRAKEGKVKWLVATLPDKAVAAEVSREIDTQIGNIDRLKARLSEVEAKIHDLLVEHAKTDVIAKFLTQFADRFEGLESSQKRLLIQSLVKEIVVKNRHDARVVFVLPLPLDSQPGLPKQNGGSLVGSRHKQVPSELLSGGVRYPLGAKWGP